MAGSMADSDEAPWWFGAVFILAGGAIMAIGLDWIRVDPSSIHAPRWVLTACGGMFALAGAMVYTSRLDERVNHVLAFLLIGMVASVASWVAFGPGERAFTGGASVGPVAVGGSGGERIGRAVFGFGAVVLWLMELVMVVRLIRSLAD